MLLNYLFKYVLRGDIYPIHMSNFRFLVSASNQFFDVIVKKRNFDMKKLIMMQKLDPKIASLKPTKTGHVDRVIDSLNYLSL